jgi:hypothetical protein
MLLVSGNEGEATSQDDEGPPAYGISPQASIEQGQRARRSRQAGHSSFKQPAWCASPGKTRQRGAALSWGERVIGLRFLAVGDSLPRTAPRSASKKDKVRLATEAFVQSKFAGGADRVLVADLSARALRLLGLIGPPDKKFAVLRFIKQSDDVVDLDARRNIDSDERGSRTGLEGATKPAEGPFERGNSCATAFKTNDKGQVSGAADDGEKLEVVLVIGDGRDQIEAMYSFGKEGNTLNAVEAIVRPSPEELRVSKVGSRRAGKGNRDLNGSSGLDRSTGLRTVHHLNLGPGEKSAEISQKGSVLAPIGPMVTW